MRRYTVFTKRNIDVFRRISGVPGNIASPFILLLPSGTEYMFEKDLLGISHGGIISYLRMK